MEGEVVDDRIADLGAENNAYTSQDQTQYLTVVHKRALAALLSVEGQRLLDPLAGVTEDIVRVEREIVRNEIHERFDGRSPVLTALLAATVDPAHPYARPVAGTEEAVEQLTLEQVAAYADRQYRPSLTSLFLTGDVDPDDVPALVRAAFPAEVLADPTDPEDTAPGPASTKPAPRCARPR